MKITMNEHYILLFLHNYTREEIIEQVRQLKLLFPHKSIVVIQEEKDEREVFFLR